MKLTSLFLSFLIKTDEGNILVDAGMHTDIAVVLSNIMKREVHKPEEYLPARLEEAGVSMDDIDTVILTHMHIDHTGWLPYLKKATVFVQVEEYNFTMSPPTYATFYVRDRFDSPDIKWSIIDGDLALMPGVTLIFTPGYTPGCQPVMVELPDSGNILLPVDACPIQENYRKELIPTSFGDPRQSYLSLKRLNAIAKNRKARILTPHDYEFWSKRMKKSPEAYT